jgi:hypothetical protein
MSDDKKWSGMKVEELRVVAKKYKAFHNLGNISKANKGALIDTLKKFMSWEGESLKQKTSATPITVEKVASKPKPKPDASKPTTPKPKPASAPPASPPKPTPKQTDTFLKKMLLEEQVKKGKAKAKDAVGDAKTIAEQVKKMMDKPKSVEKQIQELPYDLQDLIYKKLPEKLQKDSKEGTEAEQKEKSKRDMVRAFKGKIIQLKWGYDYSSVVSEKELERQVVKTKFYRIITDDKDNFKSASAKTKLKNQIDKANGIEMADLFNKFFSPNASYRFNWFAKEELIKSISTPISNDFVKELEKEKRIYSTYL